MKSSRPVRLSSSQLSIEPARQLSPRKLPRQTPSHLRCPRWSSVLVAVGLTLASLSTSAQTYLIDFGGANITTQGPIPDDPNNYWNNVGTAIGATTNGVLTNLVSSLNSTSSISLAMIERFNGVNENGTQSSALYPVDATRDSLYGNTEIFNNLTNIFPSFKLTGLDPATKYTLTFYASRTGVGDIRETDYTVTGGNSGLAVLNAADNIDTTASVADITPDGAGEIRIDLTPSVNNNNGNHFTYLGVLQVVAVPPQTPLTFVQQPTSQRVIQLKPATFTCQVSGPPPHLVQWFENGSPIQDANQFSYTIPAVDLSMNGYLYSVTVSNLAFGVTSTNAVLTVLSDTNRPLALSASSYDGSTIQVVFNEPMDVNTSSDAQNYAVNSGAVAVSGAQLNPDGQSVTLSLGGPVTGTFTVVMNLVQDSAGNPIAPNTSVTGAVVAIEAQDFLFDFGGNNQTQFGAPPDDPVNYWNNVTGGIGTSDTGEMVSLISVHNTPSSVGLAMIRRFNGVNENGTQLSTQFAAQATRDSLFGNTGVFSGLSNIFPSFKLTGLNPISKYSLTFYASRTSVGDNRETGYTVEGANNGFAALNAANNINNTTKVEGITPTALGEITISLAPTANNNNPNTFFTYLGAMRLSPYATPLQFSNPVITNGKIKLEWTGTGSLLRAPAVNGPWTAIAPSPTSPYEDNLVPGENRFYRLQQ